MEGSGTAATCRAPSPVPCSDGHAHEVRAPTWILLRPSAARAYSNRPSRVNSWQFSDKSQMAPWTPATSVKMVFMEASGEGSEALSISPDCNPITGQDGGRSADHQLAGLERAGSHQRLCSLRSNSSTTVTATSFISLMQSEHGVSTALIDQRNLWHMHRHWRCMHRGLMNVVESSGFSRSRRSVLENVLLQTRCGLGEAPQPIARIELVS
jgi:hypothetical protein